MYFQTLWHGKKYTIAATRECHSDIFLELWTWKWPVFGVCNGFVETARIQQLPKETNTNPVAGVLNSSVRPAKGRNMREKKSRHHPRLLTQRGRRVVIIQDTQWPQRDYHLHCGNLAVQTSLWNVFSAVLAVRSCQWTLRWSIHAAESWVLDHDWEILVVEFSLWSSSLSSVASPSSLSSGIILRASGAHLKGTWGSSRRHLEPSGFWKRKLSKPLCFSTTMCMSDHFGQSGAHRPSQFTKQVHKSKAALWISSPGYQNPYRETLARDEYCSDSESGKKYAV